MYHEGSRKLQDQFDTRRMADRFNEVLVTNKLSDYRDLIESRDMFELRCSMEYVVTSMSSIYVSPVISRSGVETLDAFGRDVPCLMASVTICFPIVA